MSTINSTFVIAVHDEILRQTGVGREGCHLDKLESVGTVLNCMLIKSVNRKIKNN